MLLVFQVCFFVGIGLIILSFVLGNLFDAVGIDGLDLDIDIFGNTVILPVRPILFQSFLMVFGGVGWIFMDVNPSPAMFIIVIISLSASLLVSLLIHHLVLKPLKKAQNTNAPNAKELVGISATVTESIFPGGFGEIRYIINGNSFVSPAKATNGSGIKAGKEVAICWIEDHIFYVVGLDDIKT